MLGLESGKYSCSTGMMLGLGIKVAVKMERNSVRFEKSCLLVSVQEGGRGVSGLADILAG